MMEELKPKFRLHWVNSQSLGAGEYPVLLEYFSFVLATGGSCVYRTVHGRFEVGPGMIFCSYPNVRELVQIADGFSFVHLFFSTGITRHPLEPCGAAPGRPTLRVGNFRMAEELMEEILGDYRQHKRGDTPAFFSRVYRLQEIAMAADAVSMEARAGRNLVEEIQRVFDIDSGSRPSVSHIAGALGVSTQSLLAACQRELGKTTQEFLADLRLRKAKRLLRNTSHKLAYIAAAAGYAEEKYFLHCFKQVEGVTPSQWRSVHGLLPMVRGGVC